MPVIEESMKLRKNIMVVDDHPPNLKLLEDMLGQQGYKVRSFPRGRLALAAAVENPPDLVLLDINMPEMNGYETCEKLKSNPRLSQIPVIFLSALDATSDKVKAFQSGGVDYVSKPFQFEEVLARVETHLELRLLQRELQLHNERLEETVQARTRELSDAHAQLKVLDQAKSEFLNLISHEVRTPLNGILGVGEIMLDEIGSQSEAVELRELFEVSRRRMLAILDDALLLTQMEVDKEKFSLAPAGLNALLKEAVGRVAEFARSRQVSIDPPPADLGTVLGEEKLLVRALEAVIETAVKFSNPGTTVSLACESRTNSVDLIIESHGGTIPASALHKFFDLFSISDASTPAGDLGLDPPVAYRILSVFGGTVRVENRNQDGIRQTVSLKCSGGL